MSVSQNSSSTTTSESLKDSPLQSTQFMTPSLLHEFSNTSHKTRLTQISKKMNETQDRCCICSSPHLLNRCQKDGCVNSFHVMCVSFYFPELLQAHICPAHLFKHLEASERLINLANNINLLDSLCETVKNERVNNNQTDHKGKFFWFGICQQYFSGFLNRPCVSLYEKSDEKVKKPSWVEEKIEKTMKKIAGVTNLVDIVMKEVKVSMESKGAVCKEKKIESGLKKCGKIVSGMREEIRKNYEKIQMKENEYQRRDYHLLLPDDSIVCSICDNGESVAENLIVICSRCNIAVHSVCYNIENVPDGDWICDVCHMSAFESPCVLCPIKGGARKLAQPNKWVHVTCAKHLLSTDSFTWDIRKIDPQKFKLKCFSCNTKTGACVQCQFRRCLTSFHIECRKDLISSPIYYCPQHKLSKLSIFLKQEQESSEKFIQKIAAAVWKPKKLEKPQKNERKALFIDIKLEKISLKLLSDNKVIKEIGFKAEVEEKNRKKCRRIRTLRELQKGKNGDGMEMVRKDIRKKGIRPVRDLQKGKSEDVVEMVTRKKRKRGIRILKSEKGELWIRMEVPHEIYEGQCRKVQRV